jgi:hypothetical protein
LVADRGPDLAFDERLGEHGQEVAQQQRFDAVRCLEVDRRDFLRTFEQVVAALKVRLVVVGGEDFGSGHHGVVGDEREAAIGDRVVGRPCPRGWRR